MKALGTGWNRHVGWSDIEVVRERGHAPAIVLSGKAADFARSQKRQQFPSQHYAHRGERDRARDRGGLSRAHIIGVRNSITIRLNSSGRSRFGR